MLDYYLPTGAKQVELEVSDGNGKLVRRVKSGQKPPKRPPLPIAERWFPIASMLDTTAGMHRYVWDMRWGAAGDGDLGDDEGFGAPAGPRVAPGSYQLKLIVDGKPFTELLKVVMDPRSAATHAELDEQQNLGLEIFAELRKASHVQAEVSSTAKRLAEIKQSIQTSHPELLTQISSIESAIARIQKGTPGEPGSISGLSAAVTGLGSSLRVVEGGDRTPPAQALDVYRQSKAAAGVSSSEWQNLKAGELAQLNRALEKAGLKASYYQSSRRRQTNHL